ncbi:uncharacterized protein LOC111614388 [Centruroides sculpturatus]|uniref:uncharacterized protein LOC111614388 n=1 Tax=Centruroides sculpturatus TaxID=218467 RepID=UPI000C6E446A|nr:uncharacterized protein LOC111614388 [Centruroides sculpturatus]
MHFCNLIIWLEMICVLLVFYFTGANAYLFVGQAGAGRRGGMRHGPQNSGRYNYCREVAEVFVSHQQNIQLGSEDMHVEIDETFTRRRKYNRGRVTKGTQITIFGAYCRETKEVMYWHVDNKSRRVLWSHMLRYIACGSIIVSDSAAQYRGCTTMGFSEHKTVNHSQRGPGR